MDIINLADEDKRMTRCLSKLKYVLGLYFKERPQIDFEQEYMLCYSDKNKKITAEKACFYDFGFDGIQMADNVDLINDLKKTAKTFRNIRN